MSVTDEKTTDTQWWEFDRSCLSSLDLERCLHRYVFPYEGGKYDFLGRRLSAGYAYSQIKIHTTHLQR